MNGKTIRTGGFALLLFLFLGLCSLAVFFLSIINSIKSATPLLGVASIMYLYLSTYCFSYLSINKITITDEIIFFQNSTYGSFIPFAADSFQVPFSNIKHICLGNEKFLATFLKDRKDLEPQFYHFYNRFRHKMNRYGAAAKSAAHFTVYLMLITCEDQLYFVSTKPYSKTSFSYLMTELKKLNLPVFTQNEVL